MVKSNQKENSHTKDFVLYPNLLLGFSDNRAFLTGIFSPLVQPATTKEFSFASTQRPMLMIVSFTEEVVDGIAPK